LRAIAGHAAGRIKNIRLIQELLAAKEAETFHQMSSFFIHDLKNMVSTLSLLVQNAEDYIGDPSFQEDAVKTLKTTVIRMNHMISNLTLLLRGPRISPSPLNLNELIEETLSTLNGRISSRIVRQMESLPLIQADREQMQKVCLNLLLNAIEASPPDREIEIGTSVSKDGIILRVTDHGCGMPQDFIKSSLFRPFRTTKPNGLGIGLFQCKKIIEAHRGRILVESIEGQGSTFKIVLPVD